MRAMAVMTTVASFHCGYCHWDVKDRPVNKQEIRFSQVWMMMMMMMIIMMIMMMMVR